MPLSKMTTRIMASGTWVGAMTISTWSAMCPKRNEQIRHVAGQGIPSSRSYLQSACYSGMRKS